MKIRCEECSAKYSISESLLQKDITRFRCKRCKHILVVKQRIAEPEMSLAQRAQADLLHDEFDEALSGVEEPEEKTMVTARPILPNHEEQGLVLRSEVRGLPHREEAEGQEDVDTRVFNIGALQMLRQERKNAIEAKQASDHGGAPVAVVSPGIVTPLPPPAPRMALSELAQQESGVQESLSSATFSRNARVAMIQEPEHSVAAPLQTGSFGGFVSTQTTSPFQGHQQAGLFAESPRDDRRRHQWLLAALGGVVVIFLVACSVGGYMLLREARSKRVSEVGHQSRLMPRPTTLVPVPVQRPVVRVVPRTQIAKSRSAPVSQRPVVAKRVLLRRSAPRRRRIVRRKRRYVRRKKRRFRQARPSVRKPAPGPLAAGWRVPPPPPPPSQPDGRTRPKKRGSSLDVNELNRVLSGQ